MLWKSQQASYSRKETKIKLWSLWIRTHKPTDTFLIMKLEPLLEEIIEAEKVRGKIKLVPIIEMYKKVDYRLFLNYTRDYIWFGKVDYE